MAVWFADVGEKVLQQDLAPPAACGTALRLGGARGEHVTFQVAVRSSTALTGVSLKLTSTTEDLGPLVIRREYYTLVTAAASNTTSRGPGMYPDALPFTNDTVHFPQGGDAVMADETAVFWLTFGPLPSTAKAGVHTAQLSVGGTGVQGFPVDIQVWDFELPDAAHASQWTETDPFGAMASCNIIDTIRPKRCYAGPSCKANQSSSDCYKGGTKPCLQTSVVDAVYENMAEHRVNRVAWMESWEFAAGIGLTIANDTRSMEIDTAAFDRNFEKLVELGYRDLKFPVPGCFSAGSCSLGLDPNATFTFVNSSVASYDPETGRAWWGTCTPAESWRPPGYAGGVPYPHAQGIPCASQPPMQVAIWQNKTLNAPSKKNASVPTWKDQDVGDQVEFNPEFLRLWKLMMDPLVRHMVAKGWINRTYAFIGDEVTWPCYNNGANFTVNAWVKVAQLYKSMDPRIRIQQDLAPASHNGPTWKAVEPLVDAWVLQGGQITGFNAWKPGIEERVAGALELVAAARHDGKEVYMYNNELSVIDLSSHRTRTFPWSIWRTNYAYPKNRHAGLQGSLNYYTTDMWTSDPWTWANTMCGSPMGQSAHTGPPRELQCPPQCPPPGPPRPPPPPSPPPPNQCKEEAPSGLFFVWYPPADEDICHSPPVTSVRWELFRQGLEDVEYLAMLDKLAGLADQKHSCGYEYAVLRGPSTRLVDARTSCCDSLDTAKAALDAVDEVVWGLSPNWQMEWKRVGYLPENRTAYEPYTFDPAVLHRVLDGVARAIESVKRECEV
eukprot:SAG31_NODE_3873_length_3795_cov_3.828734_2_plen_780_part_00